MHCKVLIDQLQSIDNLPGSIVVMDSWSFANGERHIRSGKAEAACRARHAGKPILSLAASFEDGYRQQKCSTPWVSCPVFYKLLLESRLKDEVSDCT
jgi:hypothetical protein